MLVDRDLTFEGAAVLPDAERAQQQAVIERFGKHDDQCVTCAGGGRRDAPCLDVERTFKVGPPDEKPLEPASWKIQAPAAGSRAPLTIAFPEPLDHGLLLRALGVVSPDGKPLPGDVVVGEHELTWSFTPRTPWAPGSHNIVAFAMLEDLAGNRIGRAFEVDQFDRTDKSGEPEKTLIPFAVKP